MKTMGVKVLAATDGSKYGQWAIEWLSSMPFKAPPAVQVLHVVDTAGLRAPFLIQPLLLGTQRYLQAEVQRMERAAKAIKNKSALVLSSSGLSGSVKVDRGRVGPTIIQHAKRRITLLSIGSRGLDALDRFMLGSHSNYVIHHAPCPVLVVKESPRPIRHILLAVDGSRASDQAVRFLLRQVNPLWNGPNHEPVMVTLVHVMPALTFPGLQAAGRGIVQRQGEKVAKARFQVQEAVKLGNPAEEILKLARQRKVDLIVTGARGLGAVSRALLGSVSTRLVQHAGCSVLVV